MPRRHGGNKGCVGGHTKETNTKPHGGGHTRRKRHPKKNYDKGRPKEKLSREASNFLKDQQLIAPSR